jgi:hypothetical protein
LGLFLLFLGQAARIGKQPQPGHFQGDDRGVELLGRLRKWGLVGDSASPALSIATSRILARTMSLQPVLALTETGIAAFCN